MRKGKKMKLSEKIELLATEQNAAEYAETSEKFTFCIDLLEISAHRASADVWVNRLEDRFDLINGAS